jgi:4-hydroxymandelate oxidase
MSVDTGRRAAFRGLRSLLAASVAQGSGAAGDASSRLPPAEELVNLSEFEDAARLKLDRAAYRSVAGSGDGAFDRLTFRPRVLVSSATLDLTTDLFGLNMFAPLLVGPISQQRRFHPDGELATVKGAEAAQTVVVVSSRSSEPLARIAAETKSPLWYQVYPDGDTGAVRDQMQQAVSAGCKAICITCGDDRSGRPARATRARPDWRAISALQQGIEVPMLLKGILTKQDAKETIERGLQGMVVSNGGTDQTPTIDVLSSIVDAVEGKVPVLIDGGFTRGSDVIKALALGARAVLLGRPVMWGLAAYGANGVRLVLELVQSELARIMVVVGRPTVPMIDRSLLRAHRSVGP